MTPLVLHNVNGSDDKIDPRTWEAKFAHLVTGRWFSTTQRWTWDGGDALVVLCGRDRPECWVVIRFGNRIQIFETQSIAAALAGFGYQARVALSD